MTGGRFVSVESRSVLSARDRELVGRVAEAARELDQLARRLPSTLHVMRDNLAGQPRASTTSPGSGGAAWCWEHERTVVECDQAGELCTGELIAGPADPTGNAGLVHDQAAADHAALTRALKSAVVMVQRSASVAAGYPTDITERLDVEPEPGDMWCRCCWKDGKTCVPITLRSNGQPYYRGLCKWCGQQRAELGGLPPTWMVAMHNRGERINAGHMEKARREIEALKPKKGSAKAKRKRAASTDG